MIEDELSSKDMLNELITRGVLSTEMKHGEGATLRRSCSKDGIPVGFAGERKREIKGRLVTGWVDISLEDEWWSNGKDAE